MRTRRMILSIVAAVALLAAGCLVVLIVTVGLWPGLAVGAAGAGAVLALDWSVVHPWQVRWGATDEEVRRVMPGDELVTAPASSPNHWSGGQASSRSSRPTRRSGGRWSTTSSAVGSGSPPARSRSRSATGWSARGVGWSAAARCPRWGRWSPRLPAEGPSLSRRHAVRLGGKRSPGVR